jgi:hypothetical protein
VSVAQALARRRAMLLEEAGHLRSVADELARTADEVEHGLDAVVATLGPPVWSGRGAEVASAAGEAAREDLRVAAGSLREVCRDLELAAGTLEWRVQQANADAAVNVP